MSKTDTPAKGAAFFFEGHEYEYEGGDHGLLTFVRPEGAPAGQPKRVTVAAAEVVRSTAASLVEPAQREKEEWLRRLPPAPPTPDPKAPPEARKAHRDTTKARANFRSLLDRNHTQAHEKLRASPTRQYYHLHADPQDGDGARPLRLVAPPVERAALKVAKVGVSASHAVGETTVTQTPQKEG